MSYYQPPNVNKSRLFFQLFLMVSIPWIVPMTVRLSKYNLFDLREVMIGTAISALIMLGGEVIWRWRGAYYLFILIAIIPGSLLAAVHALSTVGAPHVFDALSLFDTSGSEANEFANRIFSWFDLLLLIPLLVPFAILKHLSVSGIFSTSRAQNWFLLALLLIGASPAVAQQARYFDFANWSYRARDYTIYPYHRYLPMQPYWVLYDGYGAYFAPLSNVSGIIGIVPKRPFFGQGVTVVVVGESLTRKHMGVYGYFRNTTPRLSALSHELVIFDNVWTPFVHTVPSLAGALTVELEGKRISLLSILNEAGFTTWWISNQPQFGANESRTSLLTSSAGNRIWLNPNSGGHLADDIPAYDSVVLGAVQDAIRGAISKRVVFVHLMGSHDNYARRYPAEYHRFTDAARTDRSPEHLKIINAYDNSILYNDYILGSIIDILKSSGTASALIYFSDHGDDVFDSADDISLFHTQSKYTQSMRQIPLILWSSTGFSKVPREELAFVDQTKHLPFRLDNLSEFLADLIGFDFPGRRAERSPLGPKYVPDEEPQ